jgi:hypothetical protein
LGFKTRSTDSRIRFIRRPVAIVIESIAHFGRRADAALAIDLSAHALVVARSTLTFILPARLPNAALVSRYIIATRVRVFVLVDLAIAVVVDQVTNF